MNSRRFAPSWCVSSCLLLLAGCNREPAIGPEIHDTKYRAVNEAGEVLDPSMAPGACALDTFTGLTWEPCGAQTPPGPRAIR